VAEEPMTALAEYALLTSLTELWTMNVCHHRAGDHATGSS
jgi:hypothetical protein